MGKSDGSAFNISGYVNDAGTLTGYTGATHTTSGQTDAVVVANTITDMSIGDVINTAGVATITKDYYEGKVGSLAATNADATVIVLTGAGYLSAADAEDSYTSPATATDHGLVIFYNSAKGYAQMIRDNDMDADGTGDEQVYADFTNITSLTQLAEIMSTDTFVTA